MTRDKRTSSVDQTIDENLKRAFEDVASEPLPSRFSDLLDKLKKTEPSEDDSSDPDSTS